MEFRSKRDGSHFPLGGRNPDSGTFDRVRAQNSRKDMPFSQDERLHNWVEEQKAELDEILQRVENEATMLDNPKAFAKSIRSRIHEIRKLGAELDDPDIELLSKDLIASLDSLVENHDKSKSNASYVRIYLQHIRDRLENRHSIFRPVDSKGTGLKTGDLVRLGNDPTPHKITKIDGNFRSFLIEGPEGEFKANPKFMTKLTHAAKRSGEEIWQGLSRVERSDLVDKFLRTDAQKHPEHKGLRGDALSRYASTRMLGLVGKDIEQFLEKEFNR